MQPRRVLITTDAVGGVWRYALDLAMALGERGIRCLLAGYGPPPDATRLNACRRLQNVEIVWLGETLDWLAEDEAALDSGARALAALARDWRPDLLHLNLPSQAAEAPSDAIIVTASHSCLPTWWAAVRGDPLPLAWQWHRQRNRRGFDRADVVLVPSAAHGEALQRIYGLIDDLHVVHNATGTVIGEGTADQFVLAAGRWWDEGKGGATLDQAAAATNWPVIMAGPLAGPAGQHLTLRHAEAPGELPADKLLALMRRAAIFAAPSRYEPFGLAVLEAAASGAALILSDIPTFRELWDGAATFIAPDDPAAWAEAINRLMRDPPRLAEHARAARIRAESFGSNRQISGILESYDIAMKNHASVAAVQAMVGA